jgi:hypothetical protein
MDGESAHLQTFAEEGGQTVMLPREGLPVLHDVGIQAVKASFRHKR